MHPTELIKKTEVFLDTHTPNLLAKADLTFEFGLKIEGFTVWKSRKNGDINIEPPKRKAHKGGAGYKSDIYFEDKQQWRELQEFIKQAYLRKKQQQEDTLTKKQVNEIFADTKSQ